MLLPGEQPPRRSYHHHLGVKCEGEWQKVRYVREAEVERLREALSEAIGWSYGDGPTPERRDELERLLDAS